MKEIEGEMHSEGMEKWLNRRQLHLNQTFTTAQRRDLKRIWDFSTKILTLRRPDGSTFKCTKGAPQIILDKAANKHEIYDRVEQAVQDLAAEGADDAEAAPERARPSVAVSNVENVGMFLIVVAV